LCSWPISVAFLLVPGFSLFTLSSAIEAFRVANELTSERTFEYVTVTDGARQVTSSDGVSLIADTLLTNCPPVQMIFVVSSLPAAEYYNRPIVRWLRRRAYSGTTIAALGSATVLVAKTGLLDGYSCVTHWRLHEEFVERFPNINLLRGLYIIDRDRITSGGGLATFDLALAIVARELGQPVAAAIADAVLHPRIRASTENPRMAVPLRYGVTDTRIVQAIESMEDHIEQPLPLLELARTAKSSPRHLQRLFEDAMGKSPHQVYNEIRLRAGRHLLQQSTLSIAEIALRSGFADASHFTRRYREHFGETPAQTRKALHSPDTMA
jgi:transcriptional regulator GlxA family with amidase domain